MNILEQIYDTNLPKINFYERKITIDTKRTIIQGPPKSGKSYLIYDYLSSYKREEYLYIDFADYKNNSNEIIHYLDSFLEEHPIEVLVLENFAFDFDIAFDIDSIIITTKNDTKIKGFSNIYVECLDFEEYLLFDKKHQSSSNSFNSFLKFGNFPEIIEYAEPKKAQRNYEISKLYCEDATQLQILFLLIKNAGEKKSIFQLFNSLKKDIKVSKDTFYKTCENFQNNKVIHLCEKFEQPKAVKKIFVYNYALLDIVSYKKNFNNLFKNMTYLELQKRYTNIYYFDNVDFYIQEENEIVLAIPFFNNLISSTIISKILPMVELYTIEIITIVTVSSEQTIFIGEIEAQIVPFSNWAVSL